MALPLVASVVLMTAFVLHERRIEHPMIDLDLFRIHNFAIGNLQTLSMYAGLSLLFFFLVIFLQAGRGLQRRGGGHGVAAGHADHVRAVLALRRPGRPPRARASSWASGRWWRPPGWRS